jgi:2-oxoisovalerate dehydrogenase E1 component alpha subunit
MAQAKRRKAPGKTGLALPEGLTAEDLLDIYASMVLVRTLDERIWAMNRQGKAAIVASCQGHEAGQLASVWAMRQHTADHFFFPYYRDLAILVSEGMTPTQALLGFMAKEGEPMSGARQFPQHGALLEHGIINISNVVGSHVPHAVGWALAAKMRGDATVVATHMGDGATSQGEVHEAMNFASVHKLPVIFVVENNKYATSIPLAQQMAIEHVSTRGAGYGMPAVTVDGTDVAASYEAISQAAQLAASGGGPSLVELDVERYLPHTSDDDDTLYRDRAEIDEARKRDPLERLERQLHNAGLLTPERNDVLYRQARAEVDAATEAAEAAPFPTDEDVLRHVYEERG